MLDNEGSSIFIFYNRYEKIQEKSEDQEGETEVRNAMSVVGREQNEKIVAAEIRERKSLKNTESRRR